MAFFKFTSSGRDAGSDWAVDSRFVMHWRWCNPSLQSYRLFRVAKRPKARPITCMRAMLDTSLIYSRASQLNWAGPGPGRAGPDPARLGWAEKFRPVQTSGLEFAAVDRRYPAA